MPPRAYGAVSLLLSLPSFHQLARLNVSPRLSFPWNEKKKGGKHLIDVGGKMAFSQIDRLHLKGSGSLKSLNDVWQNPARVV